MNVAMVLAWLLWGVSAALYAALAGAALSVALARKGSQPLSHWRREDRLHLAYLLVLVAALVRLMSWPVLFGFLESLVEQVPGAMCPYGVARLYPHLMHQAHLSKALALAALGCWLAVFWSVRPLAAGGAAAARLLAGLALALGFALFEMRAELAWLTAPWTAATQVSCCTTMADVGQTPAATLEAAAWGGAHGRGATVAALAASLLLGAGLAARGRRLGTAAFLGASLLHAAAVAALVPLALGSLTRDVAGPVLGLPYHHCLYELVGRTPDFGLILLLGAIGAAAAFWAPLAALARWPFPRGRTPEALAGAGTLALAAAALMVAVHLLVAAGG
jgi:hypothetical protein